jgi:deoxyribonuclease-2
MILLPEDTSEDTFIYADSNTPGSFTTGDITSSSDNALANTVSQLGLYGGNVDTTSVGWVIWNDQVYKDVSGKPIDHEQDGNGNYYAHSKGHIGFDNQTGFWLTHSAPGFPYSHDICPASWSFNSHQAYFAQHFFCSTFNYGSSTMNSISKYLASYYLYVYDSNVPTTYNPPQSFQNLISGQFTTGTSSLLYKTAGNTNFICFGKNGQTGSDLWEDYVAPGLSTGLNVESWCGGDFSDSTGCQPSNCAGQPIVNPSAPQQGESTYAFDSVCIESFDFGNGNSFDTAHNHAKFAIAKGGSSPWVCLGDINRQTTQRLRGGGAMCFKSAGFYSAMSGAITSLNVTCSSDKKFSSKKL